MKKNFLLEIVIFLNFINKTINENCTKTEPILFEGDCLNRYCTKEEFENETCIISNSVAKIQWLNKIESFAPDYANSFSFLKMINNDILIISTNINDIEHIYIYGLKSNGEKYFNEENGVDYKIIPSIELGSLNSISVIIENKEYPFVCSNIECILIDYENGESYNISLFNFIKDSSGNSKGFSANPLRFPIINLNNENKILLITLYHYEEGNKFYFFINDFLSKNFSIYNTSEFLYNNLTVENTDSLRCFITEKKLIECLYYKSNIYKVAIFGENLNYITSIKLDDTQIDDGEEKFRQSNNCIHLKEEIGVFTYYININEDKKAGLVLQINELIYEESNYTFKPLFENKTIILSLDNKTLFDHNDISSESIDTKDLIKINDNKFAYVYDYFIEKEEDYLTYIVLIIFDIKGNNNENLLIKYYIIDYYLNLGYNPYMIYTINIMTFNSYTGISFTTLFYLNDDDYNIKPHYMIFGISEQNINQIQFNVTENLTWKINEDFIININNNLFGYEIKYKIFSIDNSLKNLKIFSVNINNEKILINNTTIDYNDSLLFDFTDVNVKNEESPSIEIAAMIIEPDYEKTINLCDKFDNYGDKANQYYEQKIIDEKILKIKFNFKCYSTCETCEYAGFNTTNQKCLSCKNNNNFCLVENEGNCYNIDNLSSQYIYYLDSENGNQMICISSEETEETDETNSADETDKDYRSEEIEETEETGENEESDRTEETETIDRAEDETEGKYETTYEINENEETEISEENGGIDDSTEKNGETTDGIDKIEESIISPSENLSETINIEQYTKEVNYDDIINKIIMISNNPESYIKIIDILYNKIKEGLLDEEINKEIIINGNNIAFQITTSSNQKNYLENNINTNLSIIDITECEKKLGLDKPLIILKIDIDKNESYAPQVEYLLIHPYTHEKFDASICENTKIDIYVPFNVSNEDLDLYNYVKEQGYNVFDPSDSFYNDICTPFDSQSKTDVLMF